MSDFRVDDRVKIGNLKAVAGSAKRNAKLRGSVTGVEVKGTRIRVVWDGDPENTWSYRDTDLVHCNNALLFTKPKKPDLDDRWSQDQALHNWKQKQQNKRDIVTLAHCILAPEKEMLAGTVAQWKKWRSRWERRAKRLAREVIKAYHS